MTAHRSLGLLGVLARLILRFPSHNPGKSLNTASMALFIPVKITASIWISTFFRIADAYNHLFPSGVCLVSNITGPFKVNRNLFHLNNDRIESWTKIQIELRGS
jgi:hypothetical protein